MRYFFICVVFTKISSRKAGHGTAEGEPNVICRLGRQSSPIFSTENHYVEFDSVKLSKPVTEFPHTLRPEPGISSNSPDNIGYIGSHGRMPHMVCGNI